MADEKKGKLSKKAIRRAYWQWMFYNLSVQNFERMQGPGIIKMLASVKDDLYPSDPENQKELLARHTVFFNTEPYLGCIVPGIILGMEAQKAAGGDIADEFINSISTALMGPFAGIGDSLLPGTLIPILLSIAIGLSNNGSMIGPIFYIVVFLGIMLPLTWFLFSTGTRMGADAAELVLSGGIKNKVTKAAETIGLIVVGAITASYVNIKTGIVFTSGEMVINLNDKLESVFPKLLVLLFAFLSFYLMKKKKWSVNKLMLLFLIIAIVGYFTHILAL
ncbi:MAG TPA: hypothetical protein DD429_12460 [Clostridiaceae bacterium]|nr:hypothetical protein [Clostridiaceae bacterium]